MKKFKRFTAILLSAVLLMAVIPFSVFAGGIPDTLTCDFDDTCIEYRYCAELKMGNNTFAGIDKNKAYFFSFVPEETGVYKLGDINAVPSLLYFGITAETNDDECSSKDFEEVFRNSSNTENVAARDYDHYCYLTAGKLYYVLLFKLDDSFNVSYVGNVTDVNPVTPMEGYVEGYDAFVDKNNRLNLRQEFEICFSDGTVTNIFHIKIDKGDYTDYNLTWRHLGFEKEFRYGTIDVREMIDSVIIKEPVNIVSYFSGEVEFENPVTAVINFTDGTSTEIKIDSFSTNKTFYDISGKTFEGTNGRTYYIYLFTDDEDNICVSAAGLETDTGYNLKRASFFEIISHYFACKKELFKLCKDEIIHSGHTKDGYYALKQYCEEVLILRLRFIAGIISRLFGK